jgi:hypothetical protein
MSRTGREIGLERLQAAAALDHCALPPIDRQNSTRCAAPTPTYASGHRSVHRRLGEVGRSPPGPITRTRRRASTGAGDSRGRLDHREQGRSGLRGMRSESAARGCGSRASPLRRGARRWVSPRALISIACRRHVAARISSSEDCASTSVAVLRAPRGRLFSVCMQHRLRWLTQDVPRVGRPPVLRRHPSLPAIAQPIVRGPISDGVGRDRSACFGGMVGRRPVRHSGWAAVSAAHDLAQTGRGGQITTSWRAAKCSSGSTEGSSMPSGRVIELRRIRTLAGRSRHGGWWISARRTRSPATV